MVTCSRTPGFENLNEGENELLGEARDGVEEGLRWEDFEASIRAQLEMWYQFARHLLHGEPLPESIKDWSFPTDKQTLETDLSEGEYGALAKEAIHHHEGSFEPLISYVLTRARKAYRLAYFQENTASPFPGETIWEQLSIENHIILGEPKRLIVPTRGPQPPSP